jgi:NAD(P)-dependent dehydrogenase (short-subunit alcohol dehydrogenase family)
MDNKVCMVTGANAGIGKQTAAELARRGAHVVMVARSRERGEIARADIISLTGNNRVDLLVADLSSQAAIRAMVAEFKGAYERLDVLVNNAGAFFQQRQESIDGIEMTFALNHLGYFLPTVLLWDMLSAGEPARVVNVSSDAHRNARINFNDLQSKRWYQGFRAYGQSKLANVLFTYELNRRRGGAAVAINAVHPGFVASNFGKNNSGVVGLFMKPLFGLFGRSVEEGAATSVYLAVAAEVEGFSGGYFVDRQAVKSSPLSYDQAVAQKLWDVSEELTNTRLPELAVPA